MIRKDHIISDVKYCVKAVVDALGSPVSDWDVILGFPQVERMEAESKRFIYVLSPKINNKIPQMGGKALFSLDCTLGLWISDDKGGIGEMDICKSYLINTFNDRQLIHGKQFNVTIGGITHTDTTLNEQKVFIRDVIESGTALADRYNEHREEITLLILA